MEKNKDKYKIAIVAPVPFYYHVPLYQKLSRSSKIDLLVYYCSDETLHGIDVEKNYFIKNKFVDSGKLLRGYKYDFLKNYSLSPSYMNWPFGLVNFGIWKEIKKNKYDAIILQAWNNFTWWLAFFACLIFKTPVIFMTDENNLAKHLKSKWKIIFKKLLIGNFIFKFASGFLTSGIANDDFYRHYVVPQNKLVQFHFSWEYEQFLDIAKKLELQQTKIRASLGIRDDDFVIIFVGRLTEQKNLFTLLDAYNLVGCLYKKIFIIGDGNLRLSLEQYVKDLGTKGVSFVGFQSRDAIPNFYAIADVLILPSTFEPWGIAVSEAMCFGSPIIASDRVGAAVDLVRDGYNGFIFPAEDAKQLSACIEKMIRLTPDQRQVFRERSHKIIKQWLDIDPEQQMLKVLKLVE
ncbi:MAG: glycosyltransferase family 4 protein [Candidatus Staskawiczbacteria bacterium]|nr:glycosyltransferase family 4 protein [Candidatus Staskawiczbacteria bacterium]